MRCWRDIWRLGSLAILEGLLAGRGIRANSSADDGDHFAGIHGLSLCNQQALDYTGLRRANFVLHFHGLHYHDSLSRIDAITGFYQQHHDFSGHGSPELLTSLRFRTEPAIACPFARVANRGAVLTDCHRDAECGIRLGSYTCFERLAGD